MTSIALVQCKTQPKKKYKDVPKKKKKNVFFG
jgi:hypothetical protein